MKKLVVALLMLILVFTTSCGKNTKVMTIDTKNVNTLNNTMFSIDALVEIGGDLYYDPKTRIVYIWNGSFYANLKGMNVDILLSCGVPRQNIDVCPLCTSCNSDLFYSHRRQKGIRGSHLNLISM